MSPPSSICKSILRLFGYSETNTSDASQNAAARQTAAKQAAVRQAMSERATDGFAAQTSTAAQNASNVPVPSSVLDEAFATPQETSKAVAATSPNVSTPMRNTIERAISQAFATEHDVPSDEERGVDELLSPQQAKVPAQTTDEVSHRAAALAATRQKSSGTSSTTTASAEPKTPEPAVASEPASAAVISAVCPQDSFPPSAQQAPGSRLDRASWARRNKTRRVKRSKNPHSNYSATGIFGGIVPGMAPSQLRDPSERARARAEAQAAPKTAGGDEAGDQTGASAASLFAGIGPGMPPSQLR